MKLPADMARAAAGAGGAAPSQSSSGRRRLHDHPHPDRQRLPRVYGEALSNWRASAGRRVPERRSTSSTEIDLFRDAFPERFFFNLGIAEANAIGVAAGMARWGICRSFTASACSLAPPVRSDCDAACVSPHQREGRISARTDHAARCLASAIDDLAIPRALPNMTLIEPSGPEQFRSAVRRR